MAKETRYSRTQVATPAITQAPHEQSKLISRPVPEFKSSRAGLDGLSQAFSNFFGATNKAAETLMQAVAISDKSRIEQENTAQQRQAAGDALTGKPMDPSQTDDYDYYDTYRSVLAQRTGADATREFKDWYQNDFLVKTPNGDLAKARQEWAVQNLTGTDDPEFDGMALSTFYKGTETMLGTHMESKLKAQFAQGKQNLEAVIDADAGNGTITPERVAYYIQAAGKLDPLNAHEAAPMVANALAVAVQNHPDKSGPILSTLDREGTGINGKSFSQSFPEAYAKLQQKAVASFEATNTMQEWEAVNGLKERSMKLKDASDDDLVQFGADLISTRNRYGAANDIEALQGVMAKEINRRVTEQTNFAHVQQMLLGKTPTDVDVLRKNLPDYMKKVMGIDNILTADPAQVGQILVRAGTVVPEDYKAQVSNAIMNFSNPSAQMAAISLLQVVEKARDQKFAANYLTDEAYRYYKHISDEQMLTSEPIDATLARVAEIRRQAKPVDNWSAIVGKTSGEARAEVNSYIDYAVKKTFWDGPIRAAVREWIIPNFIAERFESGILLPAPLRERITDYAMAVVNERSAQGIDWKQAIEEAVGRMSQRGEVIPNNGRYVLKVDDTLNPTYTENGVAKPRVRMGFNVYNPISGENVDTVSIYNDQLYKLNGNLSNIFRQGLAQDVSLVEHPYAVAKGAYAVAQRGDYIVFKAGETFDVNQMKLTEEQVPVFYPRERKVTFPETEQELSRTLGDLIPEGFGFIKIDLSGDKTGWMLAYRPNFGDEEGRTLQQRERDFQPPPAPRARKAPIVNAPRTPSQVMRGENP